MQRSSFMGVAASGIIASTSQIAHAQTSGGPMRVAFVIGEGATVIDFAGPWETFQDVMTRSPAGATAMPFELMTVAKTRDTVMASGGLRLEPNFTFDDVPQPHIIVVGAQRGTPELLAWLRAQQGRADLIMSVCVGAFQLARAGLLDGKRATTHHDYYDMFEKRFPKVRLVRGPRYVDQGPICTAGGLTSGIDLAVHVVERFFGADAARNVERYMEFVPSPRRA